MLKPLVLILALLSTISCAAWANASTLSWDSVPDARVTKYNVYQCNTTGCVVSVTPALLVGTVPAVSGATQSTSVTVLGLVGALGVTALTATGQESVLSVPLPFNLTVPPVPQNLRLVP
jgi:hypothetical protein